MNDLVRGYAEACFAHARDAGRLARVRDDLVVFDAALISSDQLRIALSDPALSVGTRREVVAELLSGKATEESAAIADFLIRVLRPSDLLGQSAELVIFAEDQLEDGGSASAMLVFGRSATRDRLRGYSERVLQQLSGEQIDQVEDDIFSLARLLEANNVLRATLSDFSLPATGRQALAVDLLSGKVLAETLALFSYVLRAGRARDLVGTLSWLAELCAEERGRRIAEVRSAVELDGEEVQRIGAAMSRLVSRQVEVRLVPDPATIGGVLISVGDLVIDGTVRLRFERLRDALSSSS